MLGRLQQACFVFIPPLVCLLALGGGRGGHVEAAGCFVIILGDIIFIICTEATQRSERASAAQLPPGVHRRRREQRCGAFIVKVLSLFEAQKMAEFGLFAVSTNIDKFSGIF